MKKAFVTLLAAMLAVSFLAAPSAFAEWPAETEEWISGSDFVSVLSSVIPWEEGEADRGGTKPVLQYAEPDANGLLAPWCLHQNNAYNEKWQASSCWNKAFWPVLFSIVRQATAGKEMPIDVGLLTQYLNQTGAHLYHSNVLYRHAGFNGEDIEALFFRITAEEAGGAEAWDGNTYLFVHLQKGDNQTLALIANQEDVYRILETVMAEEGLPEVTAWFYGDYPTWREGNAGALSDHEASGVWQQAAVWNENSRSLKTASRRFTLYSDHVWDGSYQTSGRRITENGSWRLAKGLVELTGENGTLLHVLIPRDGRLYLHLDEDGESEEQETGILVRVGDAPARTQETPDTDQPAAAPTAAPAAKPTARPAEQTQDTSAKGIITYGDENDTYAFTLVPQREVHDVSVGSSLQFSVKFANPLEVNKLKGNNGIRWSLLLPDGTEPDWAAINGKGQMKITAGVAERTQLYVRAASEQSDYHVDYLLNVYPRMEDLKVEPSDILLYTNEKATETFTVLTQPADALPDDIYCALGRQGIISLKQEAPGSYTVKALTAGITYVTVKDHRSGKTARVTVKVLKPVTSVAIEGKNTVKAGTTNYYKGITRPSKATNRSVEWSVDVDDSIAAINKNGQLTVKKNVASGTVITITCRALGTSLECVASIQVTVE